MSPHSPSVLVFVVRVSQLLERVKDLDRLLAERLRIGGFAGRRLNLVEPGEVSFPPLDHFGTVERVLRLRDALEKHLQHGASSERLALENPPALRGIHSL